MNVQANREMIIIERVVLSMVAHAYDSSTEEAEAGGLEASGREVGGGERREGRKERGGKYVNSQEEGPGN